jgi:hypothetical protein
MLLLLLLLLVLLLVLSDVKSCLNSCCFTGRMAASYSVMPTAML